MLYGIQAEEPPNPAVPTIGAVSMDNETTSTGLTKTATTADSALLAASLWFKVTDENTGQHSLFQMDEFTSYVFVNNTLRYIVVALTGSGGKYFQFTTNVSAYEYHVWNHLFVSADTNHAAGAKLKNLWLNGADANYAPGTTDSDTAFNILLNTKHFGVPGANGMLGSGNQNSTIAFSDVWIARGVYLTSTDVTKFRSVGGGAVDLGATGQTPTGTAPSYFFHGDATTFATNLGTGGSVTLVGSLVSVTGPPQA